MAKTSKAVPIRHMFKGILDSAVRKDPKGASEMESFTTPKGQKIQHWILLIPMPAETDPYHYIPKFIQTFQDLSKNPVIKSAYKTGVVAITQHSGLINQISVDGNY